MTINMTRREVGAAMIAGVAMLGAGGPVRAALAGRDPFTLGVASGDLSADGMVLWTRLAPDPLRPTVACRRRASP